jgi:hypothetical protein
MGRPRDGRMIYICMYMQVSIYNRQFKKNCMLNELTVEGF